MALSVDITRRRFLRQSFAFSALASLGSFSTLANALPGDGSAAEILMIGDWGYDKTQEGQLAVAAGMRKYMQQHTLRPDAFLLLGDNWYGALEGGAKSPRWKTQFEDVYPKQDFNCPAYAILGNHDYQNFPGNKVQDEIEYSRSGQSRFTMPARWYTFEFPAKNPLITFIALDSNVPHAGGSTSRGRDFTLTLDEHKQQVAWLESELKKPRTTPYLVVMGHHPIYSDGPHGDHAILIRDWDPLFRKYGVQIYLAGHDHDMQHLEFEGHPTSFFLSGGGGADLYDLKIQQSARGPYADKIYGFSHVSVTREKMTLRHLDSNGKPLHTFTRTPQGKITIAG